MSKENFSPTLFTLEELFKHIYNIPVYQRPYSWEKEQIETLLEDIFNIFNNEDENIKNEGYYTGNIIAFDKNNKIEGIISKYDVIDGQQRITSFSLILLSIYTLANIYEIPETETTLILVKECLWKYIKRSCRKDLKLITLGSIEKQCFEDLYNKCFDNPTEILEFCQNYETEIKFNKIVINNFLTIFDYIDKNLNNKISLSEKQEYLLDFADYLLKYIQFIFIEANCNENKVFSMFESLNSKGKKLEDIDLIKTYIFSKLDENSYEEYLNIWGQLIINTKDNLYNYLYTYIKAYITFYRNNISVNNFKTNCQREIIKKFNAHNECEAFKKLLNDMSNKLKFYKMLDDIDSVTELIKNSKFKFYYKAFTKFEYEHPKSLFFRTLIEFSENKITKEDVIDIFTYTIGFLIKFLGISKKESNEAITPISDIMKEIYEKDKVELNSVKNILGNILSQDSFKLDKLKNDLMSLDLYSKNKNLCITLLSLYESSTFDESNNIKISYDQAYSLLDNYGKIFSIDHLLPQNPDKNSLEYKYYMEDNLLFLKENHDFNDVYQNMDYNLFKSNILNKIGNLRLYYTDKNSSRKNNPIELKEEDKNFNSYKDIELRGKKITDILIDKCLPNINLEELSNLKKKYNVEDVRMKDLINSGFLKVGDQLYITKNPEESLAILIDENHVDFKGEILRINAWGRKVKGWKSIRIYTNASKVGEDGTLQNMRERYIKDIELRGKEN